MATFAVVLVAIAFLYLCEASPTTEAERKLMIELIGDMNDVSGLGVQSPFLDFSATNVVKVDDSKNLKVGFLRKLSGHNTVDIPINMFEFVLTPIYETLPESSLQLFDEAVNELFEDEIIKTISALGPDTVSIQTRQLAQSAHQQTRNGDHYASDGTIYVQLEKIVKASFTTNYDASNLNNSGLDISTTFLNDIVRWIFNDEQILINLTNKLQTLPSPNDFERLESVGFLGFIRRGGPKRIQANGIGFQSSSKRPRLITVIVLFTACILMAVCILCYVNSNITRKQKRQRKQVDRLRKLLRKEKSRHCGIDITSLENGIYDPASIRKLKTTVRKEIVSPDQNKYINPSGKSSRISFDPKVSLEISDEGNVELGNISPASSSIQAFKNFFGKQGIRAASTVKRISLSGDSLRTGMSSKRSSFQRSGATRSSLYSRNQYQSYSSSSSGSSGTNLKKKRSYSGSKNSGQNTMKGSRSSVSSKASRVDRRTSSGSLNSMGSKSSSKRTEKSKDSKARKRIELMLTPPPQRNPVINKYRLKLPKRMKLSEKKSTAVMTPITEIPDVILEDSVIMGNVDVNLSRSGAVRNGVTGSSLFTLENRPSLYTFDCLKEFGSTSSADVGVEVDRFFSSYKSNDGTEKGKMKASKQMFMSFQRKRLSLLSRRSSKNGRSKGTESKKTDAPRPKQAKGVGRYRFSSFRKGKRSKINAGSSTITGLSPSQNDVSKSLFTRKISQRKVKIVADVGKKNNEKEVAEEELFSLYEGKGLAESLDCTPKMVNRNRSVPFLAEDIEEGSDDSPDEDEVENDGDEEDEDSNCSEDYREESIELTESTANYLLHSGTITFHENGVCKNFIKDETTGAYIEICVEGGENYDEEPKFISEEPANMNQEKTLADIIAYVDKATPELPRVAMPTLSESTSTDNFQAKMTPHATLATHNTITPRFAQSAFSVGYAETPKGLYKTGVRSSSPQVMDMTDQDEPKITRLRERVPILCPDQENDFVVSRMGPFVNKVSESPYTSFEYETKPFPEIKLCEIESKGHASSINDDPSIRSQNNERIMDKMQLTKENNCVESTSDNKENDNMQTTKDLDSDRAKEDKKLMCDTSGDKCDNLVKKLKKSSTIKDILENDEWENVDTNMNREIVDECLNDKKTLNVVMDNEGTDNEGTDNEGTDNEADHVTENEGTENEAKKYEIKGNNELGDEETSMEGSYKEEVDKERDIFQMVDNEVMENVFTNGEFANEELDKGKFDLNEFGVDEFGNGEIENEGVAATGNITVDQELAIVSHHSTRCHKPTTTRSNGTPISVQKYESNTYGSSNGSGKYANKSSSFLSNRNSNNNNYSEISSTVRNIIDGQSKRVEDIMKSAHHIFDLVPFNINGLQEMGENQSEHHNKISKYNASGRKDMWGRSQSVHKSFEGTSFSSFEKNQNIAVIENKKMRRSASDISSRRIDDKSISGLWSGSKSHVKGMTKIHANKFDDGTDINSMCSSAMSPNSSIAPLDSPQNLRSIPASRLPGNMSTAGRPTPANTPSRHHKDVPPRSGCKKERMGERNIWENDDKYISPSKEEKENKESKHDRMRKTGDHMRRTGGLPPRQEECIKVTNARNRSDPSNTFHDIQNIPGPHQSEISDEETDADIPSEIVTITTDCVTSFDTRSPMNSNASSFEDDMKKGKKRSGRRREFDESSEASPPTFRERHSRRKSNSKNDFRRQGFTSRRHTYNNDEVFLTQERKSRPNKKVNNDLRSQSYRGKTSNNSKDEEDILTFEEFCEAETTTREKSGKEDRLTPREMFEQKIEYKRHQRKSDRDRKETLRRNRLEASKNALDDYFDAVDQYFGW